MRRTLGPAKIFTSAISQSFYSVTRQFGTSRIYKIYNFTIGFRQNQDTITRFPATFLAFSWTILQRNVNSVTSKVGHPEAQSAPIRIAKASEETDCD
jgi:hypothetical protein